MRLEHHRLSHPSIYNIIILYIYIYLYWQYQPKKKRSYWNRPFTSLLIILLSIQIAAKLYCSTTTTYPLIPTIHSSQIVIGATWTLPFIYVYQCACWQHCDCAWCYEVPWFSYPRCLPLKHLKSGFSSWLLQFRTFLKAFTLWRQQNECLSDNYLLRAKGGWYFRVIKGQHNEIPSLQ